MLADENPITKTLSYELEHKLGMINTRNIRQENDIKSEISGSFMEKLEQIDSQLKLVNQKESQIFFGIQDQLQRIEKIFMQNNSQTKQKQQEIRDQIESNLKQCKNKKENELWNCQEKEQEVSKEFLMNSTSVLERIESQEENSQSKYSEMVANIQQKVQGLQGELQMVWQQREEETEVLLQGLASRINNISSSILIERKEREDANEEFKMVLERMYQNLNGVIQQEIQNRKANHILLIRFLEETCQKIERNLS